MLEKIINYASLAATGISTIVAFIKFAQANKSKGIAKARAEEIEKLRKVNTLAKIIQQIPDLVQKAEKLFPSSGDVKFGPQKLEYVLRELKILCMEQNIDYLETEFTFEIEKILSTPQKGVANETSKDA